MRVPVAITASQLRVSVETDGVKESARDLRGLHAEIDSFLKAIRDVGKDAGGFSRVGNAATQVQAPVKNAAKSLNEVGTASTKMASSGTSAFASVTKSAAGFGIAMVGVSSAQAGLSALFSATIGQAAAFEKTLNVLQATSSATAAEMAAISAKAKALGNDITLPAVSAKDAATAMLELSKAGLSVNETISASKGVLQLAAAGQIGVADAAQITASALNSFGLAGTQAARVADLLAAAANASMADVADLGMGMQQASAIFKQANQPVEALVTSMAMMSQAGIQGSDAGTSLKTALLALIAPTSTAEGLMQKLGISVRDAGGQMLQMPQLVEVFTSKLKGLSQAEQDAALKTIFGTDAYRAAAIVLTQGRGAYDAMATSVTKAGSAQALAGAQMKGLAGTLAGLQSQWETIALEVGQKAVPALTAFAQKAGEVTAVIAAGLPGAIAMVGAAFQQITPILQGFVLMAGDIARFTGDLVRGFQSMPDSVQGVVVATVALVGALNILAAHPVIAALAALGIAYAYLRNEAEGTTRALISTNQIMAQAASDVASRSEYAKTRTVEWRMEMDKQSKSGATNIEMLRGLRTLHEDTSRAITTTTYELFKLDEAGQKNTPTFQAMRQQVGEAAVGLKIIEQEAARLGGTLEFTDAAGTILYGTLGKIEPAAAGAAAGMDALDQETENIRASLAALATDAEKAIKALRDLVAPPTGLELQVVAQIDAVTGSVKNLQAATVTTGQARSNFISQSRDLINTSGLEGKALADTNRILDQYGKGLITGEQAVKQLEEATKPHVATLEGVRDAYASTRQAIGSAAEADIAAARGWADNMEQRKSSVEELKHIVKGTFEQIAQDIQVDGQPAGLDLTTTYGEGITDGTYVATAAMVGVTGAVKAAAGGQSLDAEGAAMVAGLARGILGGLGPVVAAIRAVFGAAKAEAAAQILPGSPSKVFHDEYGVPIGQGVAAGIDDSLPDVIVSTRNLFTETAQAAAVGAQQVVASIVRPLREMQQEMSRLDSEIAKLNLQLSHTEPMSEHAAAIKQNIDILSAWKGQLQGVIGVQEAARKEWELSRTALDYFNASMTALTTGRANTAAFGPGAAIVEGIMASLSDPAAGIKVADALDSLLNSEQVKKLPGAAALGQALRDAVAMAMADPTSAEASGAVAALLAGIQEQIRQSGTLSAQSFATAFGAALASQDLTADLGSSIAGGMEELRKALEEGATVSTATVAKMALDVQGELNKLPEFMRGQFGTEFQQAMTAYIAEPTEEGFDRVKEAARDIHATLELVPAGFAKLPAPIRQSIQQIIYDVQRGALSVTQAKDRIAAALRLLPSDFAKLDAAAQAAWMNMALAALSGAEVTEQAVDSLTESLQRATAAAQQAAAAVAASLALFGGGSPLGFARSVTSNIGGAPGSQTRVQTTENAFDLAGLTFQQVQDEFGTFNSLSIPADILAAYGGSIAAVLYDAARGLGRFKDKPKPPGFAGGGVMHGDGLAYLHDQERVLTPAQARAYLPSGGVDQMTHRKEWVSEGSPIYGPPGTGGIDYDRMGAAMARALVAAGMANPVIVLDGKKLGQAMSREMGKPNTSQFVGKI
jgi:TP901 family phage tail tape measure protein